MEVEGTIPIRDLATQYGIELPSDAGFETLAGFLLSHLGYIPKSGEQVLEAGAKVYDPRNGPASNRSRSNRADRRGTRSG